jgi:hypothetical protein
MGICSSKTTQDEPSPPPRSTSKAPQLESNLSALQYSVEIPPSSAPQTERETLNDQRSERRSAVSRVAPDVDRRAGSKYAPASFQPSPPSLPPPERPRALTGPSRPHAPAPRNDNLLVDVPPLPPLPRQNRKSAPNESSRRQFTSAVSSMLSDDLRYAFTLFSRKLSLL